MVIITITMLTGHHFDIYDDDHKGGVHKPQSSKPSVKGGGGYPPFPLRKNPLKIGPKTERFRDWGF